MQAMQNIDTGKDRGADILREMAGKYAVTEDGAWLNDIRWADAPVAFRKLPWGICGMHFFGRIYLLECAEPLALFPTYIHELRHRWQSARHPFLYLMGKLWRPLIEDDARYHEFIAQEWLASRGDKFMVAAGRKD